MPFETATLYELAGLTNVWVPLANTISAPEETGKVVLRAVASAAIATGGWVSAIKSALTTAATRDADFLLLNISLSFHQYLFILYLLIYSIGYELVFVAVRS